MGLRSSPTRTGPAPQPATGLGRPRRCSRRLLPLLLILPLGLLLLLSAAAGWADEPLPPPERHTACASTREVCVTSDPQDGTFVQASDGAEQDGSAWRIGEWFRIFWVVDSEHLVTGYDGLNLVPQSDPASTVVLRFWRRGEPVRSYTLADLGYGRENLERTVSHYHWGSYGGTGRRGSAEGETFELLMVDGAVLVFDARTGELVRRSRGDR